MDNIYKQFTNPDSFYRPAPFWIWNEEMDADETVRQLAEMKEHGFGGGFAHVRVGLITPYLEKDFFDVWGKTLEGAKKLGMKLYMYDEYAWPSGFAGGLVMEHCPETIIKWARYEILPSERAKKDEDFIAAYAFDEANNEVKECLSDVPEEKWKEYSDKVMLISINSPIYDTSCGGHPFVDLSNPRVTEEFIKVTHEEYKKRFGDDFKEHVKAVFSDESSIWGAEWNQALYTDVVKAKFKEMHGYNLEDNLPALYENFKGDFDRTPEKVRYDYNCTLNQLWIDSFVKPVSKWCEENGLAWTGHDQEHSWPQTRGGAYSEQRTYEFRQWPGIDMLLCDALADVPAWNDSLLMYEVRSAANQFKKERTLVEAYGAAGWHSTFKDYKRIGDWLMVNGINFLCQHLTHYSIVGARKRDCPQSFDWRQPWWNEYTEYNDYFSRLSYLLSQGRMEQRILMLNTTTTAYMIPVSKQSGIINHTFKPDCIKNPDMSDFLTVMQKLIDEQWDFDIGDEFSVGDNAVVDGKKFKVGEQSYDIIIVSENMLNMRRETAELIKVFEENGGIVISTGNAAEYISGEKNDELTNAIRSGWKTVQGANGVHDALSAVLPRRIESSKPWPTGVAHMRRVLDDGRVVYFFVNHSMETFSTDITIEGSVVSKWDLFSAKKYGIACEKHDGKITFPISLERNQSLLLVEGDEALIIPQRPDATKEVKLKEISILPEKYNDILLDHCRLKVDGKQTEERYYIEAEEALYRARGFSLDVWRHLIQFGSEFIDKNNYGSGSGFEAIFNVKVKKGELPEEIYAVIERPDLMRLRVNGVETRWTGEKHYLDYKIGKIDISAYMKEGDNELVVWADKFDVRDEIEALILEGEFGVDIENDRFVIGKKPDTFTYGSWLEQKYRFYPNAFIYRYEADLAQKPENAKLVLGEYKASVVSAKVNGEYAGIVGKDGLAYADVTDYLHEGQNQIELRVCASFRNLYGPHLNYEDQTVADGGQFEHYAKDRVNYASEYDMIGYGLYQPPKLYVNE